MCQKVPLRPCDFPQKETTNRPIKHEKWFIKLCNWVIQVMNPTQYTLLTRLPSHSFITRNYNGIFWWQWCEMQASRSTRLVQAREAEKILLGNVEANRLHWMWHVWEVTWNFSGIALNDSFRSTIAVMPPLKLKNSRISSLKSSLIDCSSILKSFTTAAFRSMWPCFIELTDFRIFFFLPVFSPKIVLWLV